MPLTRPARNVSTPALFNQFFRGDTTQRLSASPDFLDVVEYLFDRNCLRFAPCGNDFRRKFPSPRDPDPLAARSTNSDSFCFASNSPTLRMAAPLLCYDQPR